MELAKASAKPAIEASTPGERRQVRAVRPTTTAERMLNRAIIVSSISSAEDKWRTRKPPIHGPAIVSNDLARWRRDSPSPSISNDIGICQSQHFPQFNGTSSKSPNYRDTSDSLGKQRVKRRPSDRVESPHVSGSLTVDGTRFVVEDQ